MSVEDDNNKVRFNFQLTQLIFEALSPSPGSWSAVRLRMPERTQLPENTPNASASRLLLSSQSSSQQFPLQMILQATHSSTHMGLLWFLPVSLIAIFPLRRLWNRMINSQVSGQDATSSFKLSSWVWSHVIVCAARPHWSDLSAKGAEE